MDRAPDCKFTVPGLPKAKGRVKSRIVTTKDGRQFIASNSPTRTQNEEAVLRSVAADTMNGRPPFEGAIDLRVSIFLPVPQSWSKRKQADALSGKLRPTVKPDWDNVGKLTDALNHIVWRDDSQVTDAHVWKRYSDRPRVVIEVRVMNATLPLPAVEHGAIEKSPLVGAILS